jgi:hypothetical protein
MSYRLAAVVAAATLMSCTGAGDTRRADSASTPVDSATRPSPVDSRTITDTLAIVFDPATVKVGDTLGTLRVARVDIARAADDMGYVGNVRFDGEVTISGERMNHPDFPDIKEVCMRIDSASVVRLPRFPGDTRRSWLCFENRPDAERQLGPAGTRGALTVVIDRYQTVRHFSDVYDTAMLIRVVDDRRDR